VKDKSQSSVVIRYGRHKGKRIKDLSKEEQQALLAQIDKSVAMPHMDLNHLDIYMGYPSKWCDVVVALYRTRRTKAEMAEDAALRAEAKAAAEAEAAEDEAAHRAWLAIPLFDPPAAEDIPVEPAPVEPAPSA
jgi:hypothetical protein